MQSFRATVIIGTALDVVLEEQKQSIGELLTAVLKSFNKAINCGSLRSPRAAQVYRLKRPNRTTFYGLIGFSLICEYRPRGVVVTGVTFKSLNVKLGVTLTHTYSLPMSRLIPLKVSKKTGKLAKEDIERLSMLTHYEARDYKSRFVRLDWENNTT